MRHVHLLFINLNFGLSWSYRFQLLWKWMKVVRRHNHQETTSVPIPIQSKSLESSHHHDIRPTEAHSVVSFGRCPYLTTSFSMICAHLCFQELLEVLKMRKDGKNYVKVGHKKNIFAADQRKHSLWIGSFGWTSHSCSLAMSSSDFAASSLTALAAPVCADVHVLSEP